MKIKKVQRNLLWQKDDGYFGVALEGDWKKKEQVIRDFGFRILLIDKDCD